MTTKERAHKLIDALPEETVEEVVRYIENRGLPLHKTATREEFQAALREIGTEGPQRPPLPPEALKRETIYP